jgi:hypothetical protein
MRIEFVKGQLAGGDSKDTGVAVGENNKGARGQKRDATNNGANKEDRNITLSHQPLSLSSNLYRP